MDFTALRYFSETAQCGSIRAAAERLHVAPSAISRQIAKLEHELRAPIFDRRAQGMALTAAGQILQSRVEGVIRELDRVKSHVSALQNLQSGTVDIYCFQAAFESIISPALREFYPIYPNVSFNILISSTDETMVAVTNGTAEIGLVLNPSARDAILSVEFSRETIVAVVAPTHPLAIRKQVSLAELKDFPLLTAIPSFGIQQQVDRMLERYDISPIVFCITNSLSLIKRLSRLDRMCALLHAGAVAEEVHEGALAIVPIREFAEDPVVFSVCMHKTRSLSPAAKVFFDALIDYSRRSSFTASR